MFRRMKTGAAVLALMLVAAPALAQDISADRLGSHIQVLASDGFQGRKPGTMGERLTLLYLQAQYEAMGLEPGGPDGQWLQQVDLYSFTPTRAPVASWAGPDGVRHELTAENGLTVRTANDEGRASLTDVPVVFAGYGIVAPERGWDDYGDLDVAGKIVVLMAGEPDGELFRGEFPTLYTNGDYKRREALSRGAVGVLTLVTASASEPAWQRRAAVAARPRMMAPGFNTIAVSGAVLSATAEAWGQAAGVDMAALTADVGGGSFKAVDLTGVRLSFDLAEEKTVLTTYNLLARIPGTTRPNETVIYSAHWDHLGIAEADAGGDTVYNGAWDNASGTAGLLELAQNLAQAPAPERTIVFAHMTAEEMGLFGAYAYAADPVYPLELTAANLNMDMLPFSAPTRDLPIFGYGQNSLEDDLRALAEPEGRYVTDDGRPEQGFYFRSDHFPFAFAGVPALMPWHGVDLVDGGIEAGRAAYMAKWSADYHRRSDEWSSDIDLGSAVQNLTLMYRLGLDLANSSRWPTWKADSEFVSTRAASDDARR